MFLKTNGHMLLDAIYLKGLTNCTKLSYTLSFDVADFSFRKQLSRICSFIVLDWCALNLLE